MCRVSKEQTVLSILAYLANYQDAQDTLGGIVEWWLLEQKIRHQTAVVKEVLTDLITRGLVVEREGRDAQVHFRINRRRLKEIQALLKREAD